MQISSKDSVAAVSSGLNRNSGNIGETNENMPNSGVSHKLVNASLKDFGNLKPGDVFKAVVMDIKPDSVTLKLNGGDLTARSLVLPDAHIGDEAIFIIKENIKGKILLEMIRPQIEGKGRNLPESIIKEALSAAKMQYTKENADIVNHLVAHNLPLDSRTLQKAAFFKYSAPDLSFKDIAFLVSQNLPADETTMNIYRAVIDKKAGLNHNIIGMLNEIADMEPGEIQNALTAALVKLSPGSGRESVQNPREFLNEIRKKLHIDLRSINNRDVRAFFEELDKTSSELKEILRSSPHPSRSAVLEGHLSHIQEGIRFMNGIALNREREYLQLPFVIDGRENQGELHVFRRSQGKSSQAHGSPLTALIGLDTAHLGRVEAYIDSKDKSVRLQFRSDNSRTLNLISENAQAFHQVLREKGYSVTGMGYRKIDQSFAVAGEDPHREHFPQNHQEPDGNSVTRYSFDMRV